MTTAGGSLQSGLDRLASPPPASGAREMVIGATVALVLHATIGIALVRVDLSALFRREAIVEMDVEEKKPLPPPELKPPPPPPPEPPAARPRIVTRHIRAPEPPPEAAPPPPNQEPPPEAKAAPPVFGVTISSTVSGDSAGMAVPVGNTLMTKDRKPGKGPVGPAVAGDTQRPPEPVPELFLAEQPRVLQEIKAEYPPDAQRMGIEGVVECRVFIDQNGDVRDVKVLKPAGHGFDERARQALRKFKFSRPRASDGRAVPTSITYTFRFEVPP
jgi:protein TonB